MSTLEVKQEMEEQIKEMTALCKTFSNSIQLIKYKEEKLQNDVATALTSQSSAPKDIVSIVYWKYSSK